MKRKYVWKGKLKTWINGVCIQSGKTVELDTTDLIFTTPRGGKLKLEKLEPKKKAKTPTKKERAWKKPVIIEKKPEENEAVVEKKIKKDFGLKNMEVENNG